MSPQDAIQILDNASGTYKGTRQEHMDIALAVQVLRGFIAANTQPEPDNPPVAGTVETETPVEPPVEPKEMNEGKIVV